jgi:hypothetical protein
VSISPWDAGLAEGVADGGGIDAEMVTDFDQRPSLVVETTGFIESLGDDVPAPRCAGSFDVFHDRGAADLELRCQVIDGSTRLSGERGFGSVVVLVGSAR